VPCRITCVDDLTGLIRPLFALTAHASTADAGRTLTTLYSIRCELAHTTKKLLMAASEVLGGAWCKADVGSWRKSVLSKVAWIIVDNRAAPCPGTLRPVPRHLCPGLTMGSQLFLQYVNYLTHPDPPAEIFYRAQADGPVHVTAREVTIMAILQENWRFCSKCYCLYFAGGATKGVCPAGGQHTDQQTNAGTNTVPANHQGGPASGNYALVDLG
jgi:hypothetical protein